MMELWRISWVSGIFFCRRGTGDQFHGPMIHGRLVRWAFLTEGPSSMWVVWRRGLLLDHISSCTWLVLELGARSFLRIGIIRGQIARWAMGQVFVCVCVLMEHQSTPLVAGDRNFDILGGTMAQSPFGCHSYGYMRYTRRVVSMFRDLGPETLASRTLSVKPAGESNDLCENTNIKNEK